MKAAGGVPRAEPFFLKSDPGQRFCLLHRPAGRCLGAVLYVHPFAEEMNRTRRMAALQARQLAALGYAVLQIDLYGCGDSSGDFGDARWDLWKQDLAAGAAWLHERFGCPVSLWGMRLGALLVLDYARTAAVPLGPLLLWQPVSNGASYLTQFLRLRMAGALLADTTSAQNSTRALREVLHAGETLEIGGYDLAPALALAIDGLPAPETMAPAVPVHWFEILNATGQTLPPAAARVTAEWTRQGVDLQVHALHGPPFWATSEITVCPALLEATASALQVNVHEH